jgi:hypothetical protein
MPQIIIVDCSTGEETVREMNAEELAQYNKDIEESKAQSEGE